MDAKVMIKKCLTILLFRQIRESVDAG